MFNLWLDLLIIYHDWMSVQYPASNELSGYHFKEASRLRNLKVNLARRV